MGLHSLHVAGASAPDHQNLTQIHRSHRCGSPGPTVTESAMNFNPLRGALELRRWPTETFIDVSIIEVVDVDAVHQVNISKRLNQISAEGQAVCQDK